MTGGAGGIGRETVTTLVEHGARVIIVDLSPEAGAQTVPPAGGAAVARYCEADAADLPSMRGAVALALDMWADLTSRAKMPP